MTATVSSDRPVALITGATRGLGHAIAVELAKTHHVIVGGRSAEAVGRVVDELGDASAFVADLTNEDEAAQALSDVLATVERLNVLVNNAGVGKKATLDDTTRDDWRWVLETNVIAVADVTRMCLPKLRESFGTVVVINSGAGVRVYPSDAASRSRSGRCALSPIVCVKLNVVGFALSLFTLDVSILICRSLCRLRPARPTTLTITCVLQMLRRPCVLPSICQPRRTSTSYTFERLKRRRPTRLSEFLRYETPVTVRT